MQANNIASQPDAELVAPTVHDKLTSPAGAQAVVQANNEAISKLAAVMANIETDQDGNGPVLRSDLQHLRQYILAIDTAALQSWEQSRYYTEYCEPEEYLLGGLPELSGMPYDLINAMTTRALAAVETLQRAISVDGRPLHWEIIHNLLWNVRGQLGMVSAISRVKSFS